MHYLREYTSTHAITYSPSICVVSWILNRGIIDDARLRITWTRQDLQSGSIAPKYTTLIFRSMKFIKKGETIFECTSSRIPSANRETRNNGACIENICETVMNKLLNARLYTQRRHRKARQTDGRASMWADGYCLARETRGRETPLFLYYSPPTPSFLPNLFRSRSATEPSAARAFKCRKFGLLCSFQAHLYKPFVP